MRLRSLCVSEFVADGGLAVEEQKTEHTPPSSQSLRQDDSWQTVPENHKAPVPVQPVLSDVSSEDSGGSMFSDLDEDVTSNFLSDSGKSPIVQPSPNSCLHLQRNRGSFRTRAGTSANCSGSLGQSWSSFGGS